MRPGEKLYEELFIEGEEYGATAHEKIMTVANAGHLVPDDLDELVESLFATAERNDGEVIIRLLQALVPEHKPMQAAATVLPLEPQQVVLPATGRLVKATT